MLCVQCGGGLEEKVERAVELVVDTCVDAREWAGPSTARAALVVCLLAPPVSDSLPLSHTYMHSLTHFHVCDWTCACSLPLALLRIKVRCSTSMTNSSSAAQVQF